MWGCSAFLVNRLYVIVRYQSINIQGVTYSKAETPVMYWIQMALLVCGLTMIGTLAVVLALIYAGVLR